MPTYFLKSKMWVKRCQINHTVLFPQLFFLLKKRPLDGAQTLILDGATATVGQLVAAAGGAVFVSQPLET